jgi:HKD family nuclease
VQLIAPWFWDLLERGGRLRVVIGDYMDVTEPAALHRLAHIN